MDAVLDVDWAAHWRGLVEARDSHIGRSPGEDRWASRAAHFARQPLEPRDWFMTALEPWLRPTATAIDVGAGTGRYAGPLARRLDWVTAVEPSEAMRRHIPPAHNLTVIASTWEEADPAPADLVICVHVLYPVTEPVPFIAKLERAARERVFVVLRDSPQTHPAEALARSIGDRPRQPWLRDCLLLLRQMGIRPELAMASYPSAFRFDSLEVALEQCRVDAGPEWDEKRSRAWLEARLRPDEDGSVVYEADEVTAGVLQWKPRS
jgi:SAM-dependent methyltransferase